MNRRHLRFLFEIGVGLAVGSLVFAMASRILPHMASNYLGLLAGIFVAVTKAGRIFDRRWPQPKKGWAE